MCLILNIYFFLYHLLCFKITEKKRDRNGSPPNYTYHQSLKMEIEEIEVEVDLYGRKNKEGSIEIYTISEWSKIEARGDSSEKRSSSRLRVKQMKTDPKREVSEFMDIVDTTNLEVKDFGEGKGRGIIAKSFIKEGSWVVAYRGSLITGEEAKKRELQFDQEGCYLYFFKFQNKDMW